MSQNVVMVVLAIAGGIGGGYVAGRCGSATCGAASAQPTGVAPATNDAGVIADLTARSAANERALEEMRLALADVASQRAAVAARDAATAQPIVAAAPAKTAPKVDAASAMEKILAGGLDWDEAQELWKQVEAAGKLDELVKTLEERAKARGNDPESQTQLGLAYLQKTFRAGAGPEAGIWATKADRAFDAALAVDDQHWEARFQKAVSLSFWPPMLGKQPDAVKQFETLVAQQEASGKKSAGYAQTYLFLGNMHLQMGAKDKALAAWNQGLAQFPSDAALLKKIADVH